MVPGNEIGTRKKLSTHKYLENEVLLIESNLRHIMPFDFDK